MCIGISMVIVKERFEPYWIDGNNSHTDIREKHNISDGLGYPSLPVEYHPTGVLTNIEDWEFKLDINDTLPNWYVKNEQRYKDACFKVLIGIINAIVITKHYSGTLNLYGTKITSLGKLQSVGGTLDLRDTGIESLGNLQSVGGSLDLYDTGITSLGKLQSVGGFLDLYGTEVTSLGNLQSVGGFLNLEGTKITSLDNLQSVGGTLFLRGTEITSLGELQSIGGTLDLCGTEVTFNKKYDKICKNIYY